MNIGPLADRKITRGRRDGEGCQAHIGQQRRTCAGSIARTRILGACGIGKAEDDFFGRNKEDADHRIIDAIADGDLQRAEAEDVLAHVG